MTAQSTLDPESFQKILANALLVQESGMDTESLSAIVEVERSIATGKLDVDGAMNLIAVRARKVANATGIAIGLLKEDQLIYRAGSGSASTYVGQHVVATLCVSSHNLPSGEILRVENTQTDSRIEAAICRQLGAQALLILPIYHDRAVVGVMDVLFNEPHAFERREVLSYRLMAGLVGEAMSYAGRPEQTKALAANLSSMEESLGQIRPQSNRSLIDGGGVSSAANNRAICPACGNYVAKAGSLPAARKSPWAVLKRAKRVPLNKGQWKTAMAVAVVLLMAFWISYRDHHPALPFGASAPHRLDAIEGPILLLPTKRVLAKNSSQQQTTQIGNGRWVRVGANELDYVTQDVTVRHFSRRNTPQRELDRNGQVTYVSEDVTVRYFTPKHPVTRPPSPAESAAQPLPR
jgi:putative methionine-R-sulfoxide reductase with GAF domain